MTCIEVHSRTPNVVAFGRTKPYIELISQPYIQPSFASTNAKVHDLHDSFVVTT